MRFKDACVILKLNGFEEKEHEIDYWARYYNENYKLFVNIYTSSNNDLLNYYEVMPYSSPNRCVVKESTSESLLPSQFDAMLRRDKKAYGMLNKFETFYEENY